MPTAPVAPQNGDRWILWELGYCHRCPQEKGVLVLVTQGYCSRRQWVSSALHPYLNRRPIKKVCVGPPGLGDGSGFRNYCHLHSTPGLILPSAPPCLSPAPNSLIVGQCCWSTSKPPVLCWPSAIAPPLVLPRTYCTASSQHFELVVCAYLQG